MFTDLHELAQDAPLMITIAAEAEQLRVSVTPVYAGAKPPPGARRPLSILGTPTELDADFTAALAIWQAPRRTVLQQAQDANDDEQDGEAAGAASAPAKQKNKPSRKPKAAAETPAGQQDGGNSDAIADAAGAASGVVDTLTTDMFGGASATPPAADAPPASPGEAAASAAPAPAAALEVF